MSKGDLFDEKVGPWGATVRVKEETRGGDVVLLFSSRNGTGYDREPCGFPVRDSEGELVREAVQKAREEARNLSDLLVRGKLPEEARPAPEVTFGELFDRFRETELAADGNSDLTEDRRTGLRRALECLERFLGRDFRVRDFTKHDWRRYTRHRTSGRIDARGREVPAEERREVSRTTAGHDLAILRQICGWGKGFRPPGRDLPNGRRFLLAEDPTQNLPLPRTQNPSRPVCSDARFKALLRASADVRIGHAEEKVRPPLQELLILARGTGRRIGAILALRWGDWDPAARTHGVLRWRAEEDKVDREWRAPVTEAVREALEGLHERRLAESGVPGPETLVFPALEAEGPVRVDVARQWLLEAEELAGLDHPKGFGWHAFRRAWATARKDLPSQDVAAAGGWADTQALRLCYQHADPETTERVVLHEDPLDGGGEDGDGGGEEKEEVAAE